MSSDVRSVDVKKGWGCGVVETNCNKLASTTCNNCKVNYSNCNWSKHTWDGLVGIDLDAKGGIEAKVPSSVKQALYSRWRQLVRHKMAGKTRQTTQAGNWQKPKEPGAETSLTQKVNREVTRAHLSTRATMTIWQGRYNGAGFKYTGK